MTNREIAALCAKAVLAAKSEAVLNVRPFTLGDATRVIQDVLDGLGVGKRRKTEAIDDRAQSVYTIYPRRQGGQAALRAISKAIGGDGFDVVLAKTTEYATAVARWPREERQYIPLPATWYGQRRYALDDPKEWHKGRGSPTERPASTSHIPAPAGWRDWAVARRAKVEEETGYGAPGEGAILNNNFFMLPASWQQECREELTG